MDASSRLLAAWRYQPDEREDLARVLEEEGRRAYTAGLRAAAREAGYGSVAVRLRDPAALAAVRARASWAAASVAATYDRDLAQALPRLAEAAGGDATALAAAVRAWDEARWAWKAGQIARTETAWLRLRAQLDFARRNRLRGRWYFGGSTRCALCVDLAGGNPYTAEEAERIGLPHPGCHDRWLVQYDEASLPTRGSLWLGE
jgi:hypothetical protein